MLVLQKILLNYQMDDPKATQSNVPNHRKINEALFSVRF